jgi:hypothetical protein
MSYQNARNCFQENVNLIGTQPMNDPQNWNLNNGLEQFTQAVQAQLTSMQRSIDNLHNTVNQIQAIVRGLR